MDNGFVKLSDIINTRPEFDGLNKKIGRIVILPGMFYVAPESHTF